MKRKRWRVAGINFDHFHMGDLLRFTREHPRAEIVGVSDEHPERMEEALGKLSISRELCFHCLCQAPCRAAHMGHDHPRINLLRNLQTRTGPGLVSPHSRTLDDVNRSKASFLRLESTLHS